MLKFIFVFLTVLIINWCETFPLSIIDNLTSDQKCVIASIKIKEDKENYIIKVIDSKIINLSQQKLNEVKKNIENGDIICFPLDTKLNILDTVVIDQPLSRRYEYPTDNNVIGSSVIESKESDVIIRFRYSEDIMYLRFIRVKEGELILLDTIDFK